ncbi:MAG: hypothetical protein FJX75_07560 [Armatimonadetes bacterium]|nr:hypothetical protein [Armatimonadota bacterium]
MRWHPVLMIVGLLVGAAGCRTQGQVSPQDRSPGTEAKRLVAQAGRSVVAPPAGTMTVYVDESAPPRPTADEQRRGFILFTRPMTQVLFPAAVPKTQERVKALSLAACPGEYEPAVLAIWALQGLSGVKVSVSDLTGPKGTIPAAAVEVRSMRIQPKLGQRRWGPYQETLMDVPLFLEQRDSVDIPANHNQAFWLTVRVPDDTAAGDYSGTVRVEAAGSSGAQVPLKLHVYGLRLAEPTGVRFGMCDRLRTDAAWLEETFADLRAHGMTGLILTGPESGLKLRNAGGKVVIDWDGTSALEMTMDAYAKAGFPEPITWIWHNDIVAFCQTLGPPQSSAFAEAYRQAIAAINEHAKQAGWRPINHCPVDEPFDDAQQLALAMRLLGILRNIPGVRTEANGMNGHWDQFSDEAYGLLDVLVLHDGPVLRRGQIDLNAWWAFLRKSQRDGKRIEFYNIDVTTWRPEPIRYMTGFGLWKSGAQGTYEWAYMWAVKETDPGWAYSQPKPVLFRYPRAPGESGGPTTGYEGAREGVDDYRYLLTLSQLVERARRAGKGSLADQVWQPVQAKLDAATFDNCVGKAAQGDWTGKCEIRPDGTRVARGDMKIDNGWGFGDYDALRAMIGAGIERLQGAVEQ